MPLQSGASSDVWIPEKAGESGLIKGKTKTQATMKQFGISVSTMIIRFYLMVIIIIIAGFLHQWWLSLVGGAIFLSSLLGLVWKEKQK